MGVFLEAQRFNQLWLWAIVLIAPLPVVFIPEVNEGKSLPEIAMITFFLLLPGILIFYILKLKTEINEKGVFYQFIPFHFRKKKIAWEDIEQAYVRQYKPIREYGGWGIRIGFSNGLAYNIRGNTGLQLVLKTGRRF